MTEPAAAGEETTMTTEMDWTRPQADTINAHLRSGGRAIVATYGRATIYGPRHDGWFSERKGNLYVRRGRGADCLSFGPRLLVALRLTA